MLVSASKDLAQRNHSVCWILKEPAAKHAKHDENIVKKSLQPNIWMKVGRTRGGSRCFCHQLCLDYKCPSQDADLESCRLIVARSQLLFEGGVLPRDLGSKDNGNSIHQVSPYIREFYYSRVALVLLLPR